MIKICLKCTLASGSDSKTEPLPNCLFHRVSSLMAAMLFQCIFVGYKWGRAEHTLNYRCTGGASAVEVKINFHEKHRSKDQIRMNR